ncbi:MAG: tetratricopeptide repeat protein [Verrucomicrobiota bacterium]|nr:tetratricopeptide repeat protein [Verrucomicrobiota bacterium]
MRAFTLSPLRAKRPLHGAMTAEAAAMGDLRPNSRTSIPLAAYVFAGVLLLRLVVLLRFTASAFLLPTQGDMHFYNDWALRILHGQWTDHQAFYGLPLYPYLLAAIYKVAGYTPFVPALLQVCADAGTATILYQLAADLLGNRAVSRDTATRKLGLYSGDWVGLMAAAAWAFYVPSQAYSSILMPTALAVFVFWFVVAQIVRRDKASRPLIIFLFGLLIGFSAMGIATTLFLVPLFVAALFLRWNTKLLALARPSRLVACLLGGVVLGTMPCWAHNYFIARDPVLLSAHSGVNFWIGNNPVANGYPKMPPGLHAGQEAMLQDSIHVAERDSGRKLQRSEVSRYWSAKANKFIHENPAAALRLVATKIANFWNSFQYDDLSIITNLRLQGVLLPGLRFGVVAALALAGLPLVVLRLRRTRWVVAAVALHMASLLSVFVTERYRIAAVPGLILLAALGLYFLWQNLVRARWSVVAMQVAALAIASAFVSIPRNDPSLWALDPYNSGWQALSSHNYPLAKEKLELAYAYVPTNAEINFALGNLELEQGNPAGAKPFYAATLRLDPQHEGAWNNLGVMALGEERWELAAKFLEGALRVSPDDPKTHFLLARAQLEMGRYEEAQREIDTSLATRPDQPEFIELKQRIAQQL